MSILQQYSLKDKVSIITGGARGIGRSIALAFAEAGSDIVIADISAKEAEETRLETEQFGVSCKFIQSDVTSDSDVGQMVDATIKEFGKIDILVNDAGICKSGKAEEMTLYDWNKVISINLTGQFITCKAVGNIMISQKYGSILNIASMSGMIVNTPQCQCAYNASKAGVIMLTKSLAVEWAKHGIRVNAIAPGYVRTKISEFRYQTNDPIIDRWLDFTPMGRPGLPEEIGGGALYLVSDAASFATGTILVIDGGYTSW